MHKGRLYPFASAFYTCEAIFWPGYLPRKFHASYLDVITDDWGLIAGGVVTDELVPSLVTPGDGSYHYVDPGGAFLLEILFHKVLESPKRYTVSVRMEVPGPHANVASQEFGPVTYSSRFSSPWLNSGADPPFFSGSTPGLLIRPATWAEV